MKTLQVNELTEDRVEHVLADLPATEEVALELQGGSVIDATAVGLLHSMFLADSRVHRVTVRGSLVNECARLGLASAISRAPQLSAEPEDLRSVSWAWPWTPGSRHIANALFSTPEGASTPALSGPDFATFNDPHLTYPSWGSSGLIALVRRWLHRRLVVQGRDERAADAAAEKAGFYMGELVGNIREHAVLEDRESVRSQAWVSLAAGADSGFLSLCVVDSGPGIEATLTAKLGERAPSGAPLFERLLRGSLPGWGRARGIGLSRCYQIVEESPGASMLVASGGVRCQGHHDQLKAVSAGVVSGTLVVVTLPV
jgi:hypothetical protein